MWRRGWSESLPPEMASPPDPTEMLRSKRFIGLLVIAAVIGLIVSFAAWAFLELVHQIQVGVYTDLPKDFGYDNGAPEWWSLPWLALAGVITAVAIVHLPGKGGHIPAAGLAAGGPTPPINLPGVLLAALAAIGLGVVLGPEAPLLALGAGLAVLLSGRIAKGAPPDAMMLFAACGSCAAVALIFDSPIIAAVLLIEAAGLGGPRLFLVVIPALFAAGVGSLISIGMGSWTGLSTKDYAIGVLHMPAFSRPDVADFAWTILLAVLVAVGVVVIIRVGREVVRFAERQPYLVPVAVGLIVGGCAIAFAETSGKSVNEVLFSGQDSLPSLASNPGAWSISALLLLIAFKGLAWSLCLGSFRGGPTFPALFLGAAAGALASHLPGFDVSAAMAAGMAAAAVAVLRLPLSVTVLVVVLTQSSGLGPLIIMGTTVGFLTAHFLLPPPKPEAKVDEAPERPAGEPAGAAA